jgi:hypothetical protein
MKYSIDGYQSVMTVGKGFNRWPVGEIAKLDALYFMLQHCISYQREA